MASNGAVVSVESLSEYDVLEISYDGIETYDRPPNLSENFCRVVNKIDFNETILPNGVKNEDEGSGSKGKVRNGREITSEPTSSQEKDDAEEKTAAIKRRGPGAPGWCWEQVHASVRSALTEVCALIDVLAIVRDRERRYMSLEHIACEQPAEIRVAGPFVIGKKKALGMAHDILLKASERLKRSQSEMAASRQQAGTADFHTELIALRRNWRLRRVGSTIVGDLSYRSAGSLFPEAGQFEIRKRPAPPPVNTATTVLATTRSAGPVGRSGGRGQQQQSQQQSAPTQASAIAPMTSGTTSSLEVVLPPRLQVNVQLQVELRYQEFPETEDAEWQCLYSASCNDFLKHGDDDPHFKATVSDWQERLRRAQNVLFCREMFGHLCFEAAQLSSQVPIVTTDNKLIATIFPGVQVVVTMVTEHLHGNPSASRKRTHDGTAVSSATLSGTHRKLGSSGTLGFASSQGQPECLLMNHLEIGLQSLLRSLHAFNTAQTASPPRPATGVLQMPEERRTAGREGLSREQLQSQFSALQQPILRAFLDMCRHAFLRHKVAICLEKLVSEVKDPQINAHWNVCNSPVRSEVKLVLITVGYENHSGRLELVIETESVRAYLKDSRIFRFGHDMRELENFLRYQLIHSHMLTLHALTLKPLAWPCLSFSIHTGLGAADRIGGNPAVMLLASPDYKYGVCVRGGPSFGIQMFVRRLNHPREASDLETKASDPLWLPSAEGFREVDLDKMVGGSIIAKLESVLACLTPL